jgi:hypothetical protein
MRESYIFACCTASSLKPKTFSINSKEVCGGVIQAA